MPNTIYTHMQAAVDIIPTSQHPTNKIAATLSIGQYAQSHVNYWPEIISNTFGRDSNIGNSSGTIHAETALILQAMNSGHATKGADIFITDPPCPNCMKNIAEAGMKALYIDHKGFDKDWAKRRGDSFENMSMRIAAKAGIDVYVIHRKDQRFETISRHPMGYKPKIENPADIRETSADFQTLINNTKNIEEPFALAFGANKGGQILSIQTQRNPTIGYTYETIEDKRGKYSFILQPVNRLLMLAAREGIKLDQNHIYSSRVPTSREIVNLLGAGVKSIIIGDKTIARDKHALLALSQIQEKKILNIS